MKLSKHDKERESERERVLLVFGKTTAAGKYHHDMYEQPMTNIILHSEGDLIIKPTL